MMGLSRQQTDDAAGVTIETFGFMKRKNCLRSRRESDS